MSTTQRPRTITQRHLPTFLGIGAQRCGTSWMHHALKSHPDVAVPWRTKELHFFDKPDSEVPSVPAYHEQGRLGWARYALEFMPRSARADAIGEITPAYALLDAAAIRDIDARLPGLKVFYTMRDPVDRSWSAAKKRFLERGRPIDEVGDDEIIELCREPWVTRRSNYLACLTSWLEVIPRESVHTYFLEETSTAPQSVYDDLCDFLGVRRLTLAPERLEIVNARPGRGPTPLVRQALEDLHYPQNAELEALVGPLPWGDVP